MDAHDEMQQALRGDGPELLPCPFCGGAPEYAETSNGGKYIRCSHCNTSTALHFERCENLVASWNRRT